MTLAEVDTPKRLVIQIKFKPERQPQPLVQLAMHVELKHVLMADMLHLVDNFISIINGSDKYMN